MDTRIHKDSSMVSSNQQRPRRHLIVNPQLQGRLIRKTIAYWAGVLLLLVMPITLVRTWQTPDTLIFRHLWMTVTDYSALLVCATIVLPLAIYDMLKFSNQIAGPVFRLKREIARLADGESVEPVYFRPDDQWHDVAAEFNRLLKNRLSTERQSATAAAATPKPSKTVEQK